MRKMETGIDNAAAGSVSTSGSNNTFRSMALAVISMAPMQDTANHPKFTPVVRSASTHQLMQHAVMPTPDGDSL